MAKHTALCVLLCASQVYGHGHVVTPPSRVELCKTGGNANCGQIIWEPYSVEGPDGVAGRRDDCGRRWTLALP